MGGKHTLQTRAAKAAALVAALQGKAPEEVEIVLPVESIDDKMAQAEAVVQYFETNGKNFVEVTCRYCGDLFSYKWDRHAIAFCSVTCAHEDLKQRGLSWNPQRGPADRWGRTAPIVVPASALPHVKSLLAEENGHTDQIADTLELENLEQPVQDSFGPDN